MTYQPLSAHDISKRGSEIYHRKYSADYEGRWKGRFAAIDVRTERAYVADFPEQALSEAKRASPDGLFYLIKIGSPGAFKTARYNLNADARLI